MPAAVVFSLPTGQWKPSALEPLGLLRSIVAAIVDESLVEQEMQTFTITLLQPSAEEWLARVATIDEKSGVALGGLKEAGVRIAGQEVRLQQVDGHELAGMKTYEELFRKAPASEKELRFEFLTPTCFHHGDLDVPLPLARQLFNSLYRRWKHAHIRFALHEDVVDAADRHLAISELRLDTAHFREDKTVKTGFVGRVTFRASGSVPREILHEINVLTDFAFYASAGQKTQIGMGLVRRLPARR